ncbi:hypothetical protein KBY86_08620 [Synechococcus sp. Lug-A]|nr:hypothetical protein [Synechococcus sp. Lug-A]
MTCDGRNAVLELAQQGHAFAYRQHLESCDAAAYPDREKQAERSRLGAWKPPGGIQRPWDWRAARRGGTKSIETFQQRPASLTSINPDSSSGAPPGSGRRWRYAEVGSWQRAQQSLREGHTTVRRLRAQPILASESYEHPFLACALRPPRSLAA